MINFEKELNSEQLAVVQNGDGPCLVLAGAGSGKTRTITYRVAYLLEQGIKPEEILLVTFTNKAAREMNIRVKQLTNGEVSLPWSGTFHHIGYRILRKYAPLLGYENNFTILDSADSLDLLKLCLKQEGINRTERRFPSPKVLQSIISYARNAETTIEDVLDLKHPQWLDITDKILGIMADYEKRKREANAMDFDDLLVNLHLLLIKNQKVREKYAGQFRYVMVDEYQDTNKVQASIIRLFASIHKNILVVGDDAQSIYSFRAADIRNILDFEHDYPNAQIFRLETNYRSTPEILEVANEVIANNKNQYQKELKSVVKEFTKPEVHAFADAEDEAEFIVTRILELRDEGVELRDMAVLFRAANHSQALEVELTKRDIPYDFRGGVRFFDRAHIKDVLAYIKVFVNPRDTIAWSRVLNMQVGIGPATVGNIIAEVQALASDLVPSPSPPAADETSPRGISEISSLTSDKLRHIGSGLSARAQVGWNDFLQIYEEMDKVADKTPSGLIRSVIKSKYVEYLENEFPDYRERLQDLEQLAVFAEKQTEVDKFLAEVTMQESFTAAQARGVHNDDEKIILSTIHQAKGLEWEAVFVLNVSAGNFPSDMALREDKGIEEERRLFYVAITRAKRHLYFTYPLTGGYSMTMSGPSMFLTEIGGAGVDEHRLEEFGGSVFNDPSDDEDDVTYEPFEDDAWSDKGKKRPRSFLMDI